MGVVTDVFFCIVMYSRVKWIIEKEKNLGRDLILFIGCWLDGGKSECDLAEDCKKGFYKDKMIGEVCYWKLGHFLFKKYKLKNIYRWIVHNKTNNMHLENWYGEFWFHVDFE